MGKKELVEMVRGLVRPFISISLTSAVIYSLLFKTEISGSLLQITGMVIAFHFGERSASKANDA